MCGIAGFIDFSKKLQKEQLIKMGDSLKHRGPNDSGDTFIKRDNFNIGLSHRRLSIMDLSEFGHQPMSYENLEIVYNGEIYNFREIRKELILSGYNFISDCDTEVLIKAFHKWGKDCINKFRGMWAFAIFDKDKDELVLCRDRMGVKPLYFYNKNDIILFSSELKSFHQIPFFEKHESKQGLFYYFKYGYIPSPYTIFENTFKLNPGQFLVINKNGKMKFETYWNALDYSFDGVKSIKKPTNENEILEQLETILQESFSLRMVSDVPVGIFLSGGIDSSLVTAILQKNSTKRLNTFTIGFNEKDSNEAIWAKKVANYLGTNHIELYIEPKEVFDHIDLIPEIFDEPFADNSAVPTYIVSKLAKQNVAVSLSADGGDELFCGYSNYAPVLKIYNALRNIPMSLRHIIHSILSTKIGKDLIHHFVLKNKLNSYDKYRKILESLLNNSILDIFDSSKSYWLKDDLVRLFNFLPDSCSIYTHDFCYKDLLNLILLYDQKTYMQEDILTKIDRATMAVSLEGREPFLDNKIVEFALSLPSEWKLRNGQNKYLLKKILYKYIPKELVDRPKMGFGMPIQQWFKDELKPVYQYYLDKKRLNDVGYFNGEYIDKMLNAYFSGVDINSNKFWLILNYMKWREKWI